MNRYLTYSVISLSLATFLANSNASAQEAAASAPIRSSSQGTDHSQMVGKLAFGLLGAGRVNFNPDPTVAPLTVPILGARYWLSESLGIDAGLGFNFSNTSTEAGPTTTDTPGPAVFVLHAGAPLVLSDSQYLVIEVVPETNLGFAGNTIDGPADDTVQRGFHFDIGARAGAELHFGFMDLPNLSLQAGVGVQMSYDSFVQTTGGADTGGSSFRFGTDTGPDPWDFLTSSVSALYYFGG